ncbi:MAG TPA: cytochrome d ubiquinol oxidase subunit II, partial [Baekduia sp.]|nr:cytochrome d ubiquinol oxidase subunit II [Baekduia sp.]
VSGDGLPALIVSVLAGAATFLLVLRGRYEPARFSAALAVTAIVAGWALAQSPRFLPGLTVEQAAAPHDTLVAVIVAVVAGGVVLFPSLTLLLRLTLGGALGHYGDAGPGPVAAAPLSSAAAAFQPGPALAARVAGACAVGGFGFLTVAEAGWSHAVGVVFLVAFVIAGFLAVAPAFLEGPEGHVPDPGGG